MAREQYLWTVKTELHVRLQAESYLRRARAWSTRGRQLHCTVEAAGFAPDGAERNLLVEKIGTLRSWLMEENEALTTAVVFERKTSRGQSLSLRGHFGGRLKFFGCS